MKRILFSLLIAAQLFLTSCGGKQIILPVLTEMASGHRDITDCHSVFPQGSWQFVHSIDFTMKNGGGSTVVGATALTPNSLGCALVTPEGFTLFSGTLDQENHFEVKRAVPPFDKPAFAQGLLKDLRAIFRQPVAAKVQRGHLGDPPAAETLCRYTDGASRVTDIFPHENADTCWQIHNYTADKELTRSIIAQSCQQTSPAPIPQELELQTYGPTGYILKMNLISAEHLP